MNTNMKKSPNKNIKTSSSGKEKSLWSCFFDKNHIYKDKDQLLDVIYWSRQVLAVFMGILWGFLGLKGILAIGLFIILNSLAVYAYSNSTGFEFEADESFASIKEGFMATFATFLVSWIVSYSSLYH